MGEVIRLPESHARASSLRDGRKSSGLTEPSVSAEIFSATSREGQPLPSQSAVTHPPDTPIRRAKSPRLMPCKSRYSASLMNQAFSPTKILAQVKILEPGDRRAPDIPRNFSMTKSSAARAKRTREADSEVPKYPLGNTFLWGWRKKKGVSQIEMAYFAGVSNGTVSQIENAKTPYNQAFLEAFARRLDVHVCDLLARDPGDPETIWALWDRATDKQRVKIVGMIKGYLDSPG